jgi:phytoene dehydrogenase-like protein
MAKRFDSIIIGSGIGGLALGALLLHSRPEANILMLDKNSEVGGRLFSYQKEGFKLDIGAHVFSRSDKGPNGEILRLVGKEDVIQFTYVRPMTSYGGRVFAFPKGLQGVVPDKDFDRLMAMFVEMLSMNTEQTQELDETDLRSYVQRFTDNGLVNACINNVCNVYFCIPYYRASTGEFIRCISSEAIARASGYPLGGCGAIARAIADGIREMGGEIRTNVLVEKILLKNNAAKGVRAGGQEYLADTVISNADIKHTMIDLVGEDQLEEDYVGRIKGLEYSYSALTLRIALDKVLADWKLLTHIGSNDPDGYHRDLESGKIPDNLNIFSPVPSNFAPDVAPQGKQLLTACLFVPFGFKDIPGLTDAVLDTMERLIPQLRRHILWIDISTPADLDKWVGEDGAIVGVAQSIHQSGNNRPHVATPITNLYLCGAEAGGWGVGTELAIASAITVSKLIA